MRRDILTLLKSATPTEFLYLIVSDKPKVRANTNAPQDDNLKCDFGLMVEGVSRNDLEDNNFQCEAYNLWTQHGGLIGVRGDDLAEISPEQLMAWSEIFGAVENNNLAAREDKMVAGFPILRIGNITDGDGKPLAQTAKVEPLNSDAEIQYNPKSRRPVWHTDSTFRTHPPIGSSFHARALPTCAVGPLWWGVHPTAALSASPTRSRSCNFISMRCCT